MNDFETALVLICFIKYDLSLLDEPKVLNVVVYDYIEHLITY